MTMLFRLLAVHFVLFTASPLSAQEGPARMEGTIFDAMNTPVAGLNVPHSTPAACEAIKADPRFAAIAGLLSLDPLYYDAADPQNIRKGRITARCSGTVTSVDIEPPQ